MITAKLRRIGNSLGVILPQDVITGYHAGDAIAIEVITKAADVITREPNVITTKEPDGPDVITSETARPARLQEPIPRPYAGELTKARQTSQRGFR